MLELALIVALATVVGAFYDEVADYWDENNDGVVLDNTEALRYELFNHTTALRGGHYGQDPESISLLEMARDSRRPDEDSICLIKDISNFGCTECVCVDGLLYLCTTSICPPRSNTRRNDPLRFISYRAQHRTISNSRRKKILNKGFYKNICKRIRKGKRKWRPYKKGTPEPYESQCKEGDRVPADDPCNECTCINGQFVCSKRDCDLTHVRYLKCQVGSWYNPKGDAYCRYCYCLDDKLSFCFMHLCLAKETTLTPKSEPQCVGDHEFSLGTARNCKGCTCKNNKWVCWEKSAACPNYDGDHCPVGNIMDNDNGYCSVCFCGENENICATDVLCAKRLAGRRGFFTIFSFTEASDISERMQTLLRKVRGVCLGFEPTDIRFAVCYTPN